MNRKGQVSTVDNINRKARITFPEMDNGGVTLELPVAAHVGGLDVGDSVLVAFWNYDCMGDGVVIAKGV